VKLWIFDKTDIRDSYCASSDHINFV